ncbi:MAG: hypothetical protein Q7N95_10570 [Alphaproteobacteria bacterium]|nr:hypothetical protein [Alphaproteobacteria bacterium]
MKNTDRSIFVCVFLGVISGIFIAILFSTGIDLVIDVGGLNGPAALVFMQEFIKLIGLLAWPVTVIILLTLTRPQISALLTTFIERVQNPHSDLTIGPSGLSISSIKVTDTTTKRKISAKLNSQAEFVAPLNTWLEKEKPGLALTDFITGTEYEDLRARAVDEFGL